MPMKTVNDLAENEFVHVRRTQRRGDDLEITVEIRAESPAASAPDFAACVMSAAEFQSQQEAHKASGSGLGAYIDVSCDTNTDYWFVSKASANHGWGPFLYDIAMELVTQKGKLLRSHGDIVSEDARAVWDYYFTKRPDVDRCVCPDRAEGKFESLRHAYSKSEGSTIEALTKSNRIRKSSGEICEHLCIGVGSSAN